MKSSRRLWLWIAFLAFLIFLATHTSANRQIFDRYSVRYFVLMAAYGAAGIALLSIPRSWWRQKLEPWRPRLEAALAVADTRTFVAWICLIHVFHFILVGLIVSPLAIVSDEPILKTDYAHHFHQVHNFIESLEGGGRHWSIDPSFCAGYPAGTLFDVDMKLIEVFSYGLSKLGIAVPTAFNLLIFLCFLLPPTIVLLACRALRLSRPVTVLAVLSGALLWHADELMVIFNVNGALTFVLASYLALLTLCVEYRFVTEGRARNLLFLGLLVTVALLSHITAALLLLGPGLAVYSLEFRRMPVRRHLGLIAVGLVALVLNSWWLTSVVRFWNERVITGFWSPPTVTEFLREIVEQSSPEFALGVLGAWGFWRLGRTSRFGLAGTIALAYFFFLAKLVGGLPLLRTLEPTRFMIPFTIFAIFGLSAGLPAFFDESLFKRALRTVPLWAVSIFLVGNVLAPETPLRFDLRNNLEGLRPLVRWIEENTDQSGRIAFEDFSPGQLTGAKMRYLTDRQFIGGPFSQMNLTHSFASFTPERFFDKGLFELTRDEVQSLSVLYNIRWIITTTDHGCAVFSTFEPAVKARGSLTVTVGKAGASVPESSPFSSYSRKRGEVGVCLFEVAAPPSYFLQGSGEVRAALNEISVRDATGGPLVLKYHWFQTWRTDPPLPIRGYPLEGSQLQFVWVDNGEVSDFRIYNSYRWGPD